MKSSILIKNSFFFLAAIKVLLRGRAHSEWKVLVSGERGTVRDDQVFVEDKQIIWGKGWFGSLHFPLSSLLLVTIFLKRHNRIQESVPL